MGCCNTEQKQEDMSGGGCCGGSMKMEAKQAGGCCGGAQMEEKSAGGCCGGAGKSEKSRCCGSISAFFKRLFGAKKACH